MRAWFQAALAAMVCASVASAAAQPPATVGGKVFLDANGDGKMDPGEKGLAGVRVTDGLSFATTGADGSYSITIGSDPVIRFKGAQVVSASRVTTPAVEKLASQPQALV